MDHANHGSDFGRGNLMAPSQTGAYGAQKGPFQAVYGFLVLIGADQP